jgi:hypothetical protein
MIEIIRRVEKESPFDIGNLAPVEHQFIGSTVSFHGRTLRFEEEMEKIVNASFMLKNKTFERVLRPLNLQNNRDGYSIERVAKERQENKLYLRGSLIIFSISDFKRFCERGKHLGLELSDLTPNGIVLPEWKVFTADYFHSKIEPVGKEEKLSISEGFKHYFDLFYDEERQGLYLRLKEAEFP